MTANGIETQPTRKPTSFPYKVWNGISSVATIHFRRVEIRVEKNNSIARFQSFVKPYFSSRCEEIFFFSRVERNLEIFPSRPEKQRIIKSLFDCLFLSNLPSGPRLYIVYSNVTEFKQFHCNFICDFIIEFSIAIVGVYLFIFETDTRNYVCISIFVQSNPYILSIVSTGQSTREQF